MPSEGQVQCSALQGSGVALAHIDIRTFPSDRQKEVGDNGAAKGRALETGDTKFGWQVTTSCLCSAWV